MQGRIFQIEYAMEAVKQGSATVGLKSKDYAVLVALKVWITMVSQWQLIQDLGRVGLKIFCDNGN